MSRHNQVMLYGRVAATPRITFNEQTQKYERARCPVATIRGVRDYGLNIDDVRYDCPVIMTENEHMIEIMKDWQEGDMVEIKGSVTTKEIIKVTTCPHCKHKTRIEGVIVYVHPIYASRREICPSQEESQTLLRQRCEISNQVTVIGTLCRDPNFYRNENGFAITEYQIAINRKFTIKEDNPATKTDYVWIRSLGHIAENDASMLVTGASVFIDGHIQTRAVERTTICEDCGEEYQWNDATALEIVPYATEYLRNYKTLEDIEKEEIEKVKQNIQENGYDKEALDESDKAVATNDNPEE